MKFRYRQMQTLQALSLEEKTDRASKLILTEITKAKRPSIACSFGKDSMVLLHLVLRFKRDIAVCFHNTGVQYKETFEYRDKILELWNISNYHETKPIMSFWKCVDKYGFPDFRRMGKGRFRKSQGKDRSPRCCYYLKEKPARDYIKQNNIDLEFVGLQASESMVRRLSFFREGEAYDSKTYRCRIVRPLMIWNDEDIWNYHEEHGIPRNPIYDKMRRNGCAPCTGFRGWKRQLAQTNPKLYAYISRRIGEPLLTEFLQVPCGIKEA